MEELLQLQKTEIDELLRITRNYGKDSNDRKVQRYLNDKKRTFDDAFKVIEDYDEKIQNLRAPQFDNQPYFTEDTFGQVKRAYEMASSDINKRLMTFASQTVTPGRQTTAPDSTPKSQPDKNSNGNNSVDTNNDTSINVTDTNTEKNKNNDGKQDNDESSQESQHDQGGTSILKILYHELMDCMAAARDLEHGDSIGFITASLTNLNSIWCEFRAAYLQERAALNKIDFSYPSVQQKYMKITGELNDLKFIDKKLPNKSADNQFSLPKLKLHEFHGKISEWKSYIANFNRMIHKNVTIDDGMKIDYLKMAIKGDAAKLINHIDPSPEDYHICYDILKKRYENKREMLKSAKAKI